MASRPKLMAMVLAGGEGKRLHPLTRDRAKPAVPFGGRYRLIDFALSNLVNARIVRIVVLTQYKSHSLDRHLATTWRLSPILGHYVAAVPAQMRRGPRWFAGSADAIFQNLNIMVDEDPDQVFVFGADHIYRMNPRYMLGEHLDTGAGVTVAATRVPIELASEFGVIKADATGKIVDFLEKPADPPPLPDDPTMAYVSMGNYLFDRDVLVDAVNTDAADESSKHDIGGNIIPALVKDGLAWVHDFASFDVPGIHARERGYWRDVGTLDSYFDATMDLLAVEPTFSLYNQEWPIYTANTPLPPAKTVHEEPGRTGVALNSLLSDGVIISGGTVRRSVLSPLVRVNSYAEVQDAVLLDGVRVGRGAVVRRAILDKNVQVPEGAQIGVDLDADRGRYTVSDNGIVVIGKRDKVEV
ncbi:MAG: glucose-1-phosphate adenylyltransferase [Acidimicrobiia bacterium]|nr:glucose-1-phosphate adenylyltransferase [Acidimicrobiia bacterium]MBT8194635.1 glucose-1-phosphate adenylyltransferase [Acidimicrobiia bacterium]MBT8247688.1 glucose-1-phosphate adenylyltransferase [Acidimicrobiia bacterium]NNF89373.1 glucose-1-phosphate adenylyltransferase [Acidimicrobiia bacterium]NNL14763.1 glucose-1-phosphate adenylyltransferase [Acidimicrobiia bacterium]